MLFIPILTVHLAAVAGKLSIFVAVARVRDVPGVQRFFALYKKIDRLANWTMWITGALLLVVTSWRYLLQVWLLASMLLYVLLFVIIRAVLFRRLRLIADSKKVFARDEIKQLHFESWCVLTTAVALLGGIGYLMVHKP